MAFDTILVANRGEIAVRVMRTARAMGYRTVAVFSTPDADAPHVRLADEAVHIGPALAAASYLDADKVLAAAERTRAGAIHPGYGFLSENADFAEACAAAGVTFIGPPAAAIRAMGDKAAAKRLMASAGVPLLPGYQDIEQSDDRLMAEAASVGVPLMVKAAAGGGGKGMRLVTDPAAVADAIAAARREALGAFGSDDLILERALLRPRHVEIQVLADTHGNVIHLGERDCSIQRRHQKVVEEAPSPAVDADLRAAMGTAAVDAAAAVDYVGAGTVEFLLEDGEFFFLEMNTRLQVEHPITELVTGLDLVEQQIRVARGEALGLAQDDVTIDGHAIEVRLYAEDPANGFLPATGTLAAFDVPDTVRLDSGVEAGSVVGADYDPMLAKVIAHGADRDEARRRLVAALRDPTVLGVRTNRSFLIDVLTDEVFAAGAATTAFIGESDLPRDTAPGSDVIAAAAAILHADRLAAAEARSPGLAGWSSSGRQQSTMHLSVDGGDAVPVAVHQDRDGLTIDVDGTRHAVAVDDDAVAVDGRRRLHDVVRHGDGALIRLDGLDLSVADVLQRPAGDVVVRGEGLLLAPMHGAVTTVNVGVGDRVARGQTLLVVEAMKMEHAITADVDGVVAELPVAVGAQVATDALLARIDPDTEDEA